jgi:hypothetical protein
MNQKELMKIIMTDGISFEQFYAQADARMDDIDKSLMSEIERKKLGFAQLNQRRIYRILKTYKVNERIKEAVVNIVKPQTWMILTEDWCGDCAQNLPYLFKITQLNENIELKLLYRDQNLEIMDKYLTNGVRAIPKLIAFDSDGIELFQWGPRPKLAEIQVSHYKKDGDTKDQVNEKLNLWYSRNKGKALEEEFLNFLSSL